MSPIAFLPVLAFASTILATPHAGHGHAHRHLHAEHASASVSGFRNATGTAFSTVNCTSSYKPTDSPSVPVFASLTDASHIVGTNTMTLKTTLYQTIFETVRPSPAASDISVAAVGSDSCGAEVTVTNTEKVYVTVTAGASSSPVSVSPAPAYESSSSVASPVQSAGSAPSAQAYTAPAPSASSSSEVAPVSISTPVQSAPAYTAPAYQASSSESSSVVAPVSTSSTSVAAPVASTSASSAAAYTPPAVMPVLSSVEAILPSSILPSFSSVAAVVSTTASAPASYSSTAAIAGGKRGLAYNDTSSDLVSCFSGSSQISWAYNWVGTPNGMEGYKYIPTLHSDDDVFTSSWSGDAEAAISNGATTLFSFNEPDIASQANMDVATAVSQWRKYMEPLAGKAKLCAPAVSNSAADNQGLSYLQSFLDECTDCTIDCLAIHWYGDVANNDFQSHVGQAISMAGGKPVWVPEFGAFGSDDEVNSFLEDVMPYLDNNDDIAGYAYFMVYPGLLVAGDEPSTYGSTYKSFTS